MILLGCLCLALALALFGRNTFQKYFSMGQSFQRQRLENVQEGLSEQFLFLRLDRFSDHFILSIFVAVFCGLVSFRVEFFLVGLAIALLPAIILRFLRIRRKKAFLEQFGQALPQMASTLRSGHSIERVLTLLSENHAPPLSQEFEYILKEIQIGKSFDTALSSLEKRYAHPDLESFVRAVLISRKVGSNLAEAIDRVAEMNRARTTLRNRIQSLTAQGRAQATIAFLMPFILGLAIEIISPGYLNPLFVSAIGKTILAVSAVFLILGLFMIRRICRMENLT